MSEQLGLWLQPEGEQLMLYRLDTGERLLTADGNRSRGGREGDRSMFSTSVLAAKIRQLAEKWTSPRPPREQLPADEAWQIEAEARQAAERDRQIEAEARRAAEAEVARLREELDRRDTR